MMDSKDFEYLREQGYTGGFSDMVQAFLTENVSTGGIGVSDLLQTWLNEQGYEGAISDQLKQARDSAEGSIFEVGDTLGPELLTNGDFSSADSWNTGTGWSIAGGLATKVAGNATHLTQAGVLTLGKTYRITFTVTTADLAGFAVRAGTGNPTTPRYGVGVHTVDQVCSNNTTFYIYGTSTVNGAITEVSCREVNPE